MTLSTLMSTPTWVHVDHTSRELTCIILCAVGIMICAFLGGSHERTVDGKPTNSYDQNTLWVFEIILSTSALLLSLTCQICLVSFFERTNEKQGGWVFNLSVLVSAFFVAAGGICVIVDWMRSLSDSAWIIPAAVLFSVSIELMLGLILNAVTARSSDPIN